MLRTPLDILNLFVESPGDLLFFLLVIAFSQGSLFLAFGHRSRFPFEHSTRRYVFASSSLVVIWLVMLGGAFLGQYAELNPNLYMPPLERLAYIVSLLLLSWAFLSADFIRWRNRSNIFMFGLTFIIVLFFINSARGWLTAFSAGVTFNATSFAPIWTGITALVAAGALLLTVFNFRHIIDAPLKVLFFVLFFAGNAFDLTQLSQANVAGNYLGGARLAYMAGLALLPLIIYRLAIALLENSLVEVVLAASQQGSAVLPRISEQEIHPDPASQLAAAPASWNFMAAPVATDSGVLVYAISKMLDRQNDSGTPEQIVSAVLATLEAEVCLLLNVQDNNYADVIAGYDQVADRSLSGISLNLTEQPTLLDASRRGEGTILFPDYHRTELEDLFRRLGIASPSSVYVQPLTVDGELIGVLLLSQPYKRTEFTPEDLDSLRQIAQVAGTLLTWQSDAAAARDLADEDEIKQIAAKLSDPTLELADMVASRNEMLSNLDPVRERIAEMLTLNAGLKEQWETLQAQFLSKLEESSDGQAAAPKLRVAFDKLAHTHDLSVSSARELLDAETVLRIFNVENGDTFAQILREVFHKEHNLLLIVRDRLRRQINLVQEMTRSDASEGFSAVLQTLTDETAQLELQREQQENRRMSIMEKMENLGIPSGFSNLTGVLVQLCAERKTFSQHLAEAKRERATLLAERQRSQESDNGDDAELARQLKHLRADHEQLLNVREEMRRETLTLESKLKLADDDREVLHAKHEELQADLEKQIEGEEVIRGQISDLFEERENLLSIRNQLTAKVAAMAIERNAASDNDLDSKLAHLQATIEQLTEQREQMAFELSDARLEIARTHEERQNLATDFEEDADRYRPNSPEVFLEMLHSLRSPMTSISDYTDLLLAESIGILGAAQLQVLRLIMTDLDALVDGITELQKLARLDLRPFSLEHADVELANIIDDVIRDSSLQFASKEQVIELSLENHLPPLTADANSLRHILHKLISNASEVSPTGAKVAVTARLGSVNLSAETREIDTVEILVQDSGGGIATNDLARIFARKYRENNPPIPGLSETGVGMTVARALTRALHGDLWVTSGPGAGSTFHLALPMKLARPIEE